MRWISGFLILLSILLTPPTGATVFSEPSPAQEKHCDPNLRQTGSDPSGYHLRGDRCEGVYIKEVGSTTLVITSLTEFVENFDPAAGKNLLLEWKTLGNDSTHLRAYSIKHRLYYQMDSVRPAGIRSYAWSPDLLETLKLGKNDLGILAWTSYLVGNAKRDVYLPLRIKQQLSVGNSQSYQLLLVPGVQLNEVYINLAPVKSDGSLGNFIKKDQKLGYGYYPAEAGIKIPIPQPRTPGVYFLKIGASLKAGGSSTAQIWFYHDGN